METQRKNSLTSLSWYPLISSQCFHWLSLIGSQSITLATELDRGREKWNYESVHRAGNGEECKWRTTRKGNYFTCYHSLSFYYLCFPHFIKRKSEGQHDKVNHLISLAKVKPRMNPSLSNSYLYSFLFYIVSWQTFRYEQYEHGNESPSWITALSWWCSLHTSMKLWSMPCRATQDGWVIVDSDKTWSIGGGNGKPFQYFLPWEPHE